MGATASGKSDLALIIAREFNVEIINVDAAQVYRGMNIGTAKPGAQMKAEIPHHLLDLCDPNEVYCAADFRADAIKIMNDVRGRGRLPLLVGGTLFYFSTLTRGLSALPAADTLVREAICSEAKRKGWPAMHADLAVIDPVSAEKIEPNDAQRIQRALEIFRLTGAKPSAVKRQAPPKPADFDFIKLCYTPSSRRFLHDRIAMRFRNMLDEGFIDEVKGLVDEFALTPELPAARAVGYRQILEYLNGNMVYDAMVDGGITATRRLAKRQMTWLRRHSGLVWFDTLVGKSPSAVLQYIHCKLVALGYNP